MKRVIKIRHNDEIVNAIYTDYSGQMFACADTVIYTSIDSGSNWTEFVTVLSGVGINSLARSKITDYFILKRFI